MNDNYPHLVALRDLSIWAVDMQMFPNTYTLEGLNRIKSSINNFARNNVG